MGIAFTRNYLVDGWSFFFNSYYFSDCSHCYVIQTRTLQQIQKLHGCSVRTSVNTIGESVRLLSRVGLLISNLAPDRELSKISWTACLNNLKLETWNLKPFCCELRRLILWMFAWAFLSMVFGLLYLYIMDQLPRSSHFLTDFNLLLTVVFGRTHCLSSRHNGWHGLNSAESLVRSVKTL